MHTFPITVLHESAALLVVAKPAGVTVVPARDGPAGDCLRAGLERARSERLWVVHRLDRDTSGALAFARTAEAHRALSMAFEGHAVAKTYAAWALGEPPAREGA